MKKIIILLLVASLGFCIPVLTTGCATSANIAPGGAYAGDATLVNADTVITGSYDVLNTFVTWEYTNRLALSGTPAIKKSADNVRANARQWISTAVALREAYKANPTTDAKTNLLTGLSVLQAVLTQIAAYYTASLTPPPVPPSPIIATPAPATP